MNDTDHMTAADANAYANALAHKGPRSPGETCSKDIGLGMNCSRPLAHEGKCWYVDVRAGAKLSEVVIIVLAVARILAKPSEAEIAAHAAVADRGYLDAYKTVAVAAHRDAAAAIVEAARVDAFIASVEAGSAEADATAEADREAIEGGVHDGVVATVLARRLDPEKNELIIDKAHVAARCAVRRTLDVAGPLTTGDVYYVAYGVAIEAARRSLVHNLANTRN